MLVLSMGHHLRYFCKSIVTNTYDRDSRSPRHNLQLKVVGTDKPKLVLDYAVFKFDRKFMAGLRELEKVKPTPIQAQALIFIQTHVLDKRVPICCLF